MIPAPFDYLAPETLDEAVRALAENGERAKLLAGGHSLLPMMKLRLVNPAVLIDLRRVPGLRGVRERGGKLVIGALTTHCELESSELALQKCPLLCQTARAIGDVQVRNCGTIGGSLSHADPAADWPAAILALGGELALKGPAGERSLAAAEFFLGPMATAAEPAEIMTEIRVPVFSGRCGSAYLKVPQPASGFAIVGIAVWLRLGRNNRCEDIGIGVTGLAAKPFRAAAVEKSLRGSSLSPKLIEESAASVANGIDPLEDLHASAEFRAHLARVYAARAIAKAARSASQRR
ncbi:MAG TPA: xanthine dehydrogenase family protein subunit M [Candidatus Acidoferrales bacterium]|nr:xanthine dehydrogenase family protein subunit M [Candidatus Acidoferrales bacterium]